MLPVLISTYLQHKYYIKNDLLFLYLKQNGKKTQPTSNSARKLLFSKRFFFTKINSYIQVCIDQYTRTPLYIFFLSLTHIYTFPTKPIPVLSCHIPEPCDFLSSQGDYNIFSSVFADQLRRLVAVLFN